MKLSSNEEYGLRCLVRLAITEGLTIPEISQAEGVSPDKIVRMLLEHVTEPRAEDYE